MIKALLVLVFPLVLVAGPTAENTKVGNGDDGDDLEGAEILRSGPIVEARAAAVRVLETLRVRSIPGLGTLVPEVERATLYMAKRDVKEGHFARSLPEPHAPTRFFPAAKKLDRDQLITLHVHEALHRALPPSIRTDETVVSRIAQAITSPEATNDRIAAVMKDALATGDDAPELQAANQPMEVGYEMRQFFGYAGGPDAAIRRLHVFSLAAPSLVFGRFALGGIAEGSIVDAGEVGVGPIRFEPKLTFRPRQDYELSFFISGAFIPVVDAPWAIAYGGRDVYSLGVSARKAIRSLDLELRVGASWVRSVTAPVYGSVLNSRITGMYRWERVRAGAFVEMHLADLPAGAGSFSMISFGPEARWALRDELSLFFAGRLLIAPSVQKNFNSYGDLLGYGAGQGNLCVGIRYGL